MRKIEMRQANSEPGMVAIEIDEGKQYLAVLTMAAPATIVARERAREQLRETLPPNVAVIVLPHGATLDVYDGMARVTLAQDGREAS